VIDFEAQASVSLVKLGVVFWQFDSHSSLIASILMLPGVSLSFQYGY